MESDQRSLEREIPFGFHHFQVPCKNLREGSFYHHHFIMDPRPSQRCVSLKRAIGARSFALHQFKSIENGASCAWKSCCKQLNLYICHAKHVTLVRMTRDLCTNFTQIVAAFISNLNSRGGLNTSVDHQTQGPGPMNNTRCTNDFFPCAVQPLKSRQKLRRICWNLEVACLYPVTFV